MSEEKRPGQVALAELSDTERLAAVVADAAPHGAVLVLSGPLGAGKTTFTRFLAAALGSTAAVSSPTYTLVHEYPTPHGPLVHVDAYRLEDATRLDQLGFDEYRERARLVVVEWGEALLANDPEALWLELDFLPGGEDDHGERGQAGRLARWRRPPPGQLQTSEGGARET